MASETTFTSKKIDYWTKVTSIIMIVGKFQGGGGGNASQGGISPGSPPLNKSLPHAPLHYICSYWGYGQVFIKIHYEKLWNANFLALLRFISINNIMAEI